MKANIKLAILSLVLIFTYTKANALDCDFVMRPVTTPSTCLANGSVKIEVEGIDVEHLSLDTAQYKIQELGGQGHSTGFATNGGIFNDLHTGSYVVTMRVFCKKSEVTVDKQTATFKITGNYVAPNMYLDLSKSIKTLSCKNSGKFSAYFNYGKLPYHIKLLTTPAEYTGETEFTSTKVGFFEFGDLAAGLYSIELKDDCGNTFVTNGTIGTLNSDFPALVFDKTYKEGVGCKGIGVYNYAITETNEMYYYWTNFLKYYDIYLQEDGGEKLLRPNVKVYSTSISFSLENLTFGDLYPDYTNLVGGGHTANLVFKVKDCDNYSNPYVFSIKLPYYSAVYKPVCEGVQVTARQYYDYDGVICYPYKAEIIDANTNAVIATREGIPSYENIEVGTVPYGTSFIIRYTAADGAQWTPDKPNNLTAPLPSYNNDKIRYVLSAKVNTFCLENGHTGYIYLQNKNSLGLFTIVPGTRVKPLTAPAGMELAPDTTLMVPIAAYYAYGQSYAIAPGEYTFEVSNPCLGPELDTLSVTFGSITPAYYATTKSEICKATKDKSIAYLYTYQGTYIPGGSTIKYLGATIGSGVTEVPGTAENDAAVLHKNFIMPSNISKNFNPFHVDFSNITEHIEIPEGNYEFEIHDAYCDYTTTLKIFVGIPYTIDNFGYTIDSTCDAAIITPTGRIKRGETNIYTYFKFISALNEDGTTMPTNEYPTNYITEGNSFTLQRNGYYKMAVQYNTNKTACFMDTVTIHYKQPRPSLNYALTASFVCEGATVGDIAFIKLVGVGGYGQGNGPYEYEIIGAVPEQKNTTGEFRYGRVNDVLTIRITDQSAEAIANSCVSYIEQNVTILDLSDASIAYSINDGNFCEGETILLNSVSLGDTQYNWTGPNGFTSNLQFPKLENATLAMTGFYYITVRPESCGEVMRDSVLIRVHPNPTIPTFVTTDTFMCYNSGTHNLTTLTGAVALPGNTLKWYDKDGTLLTNITINSTTNASEKRKYYVSQIVTATGCEGPMQEIGIEIKMLPLAPIAPSPASVCYGENVTICISNADPNYKYRLYGNSTGINFLQEKAGTASPTLCFDPVVYDALTTNLYRYIATVNEFGCESVPRAASITPLSKTPTAADILTPSEDTTTCRETFITLEVEAVEGIINPQFTWYNGTSSTSTILGTGSTFTTPTLLSSIASFYVSVTGDGYCENLPSQRKRIIVRATQRANTPYANNVSVCVGESITIEATMPAIVDPVFRWYESRTATTPFFEGNEFEFPSNTLYKDTTIYIGVEGKGYCETMPYNRRAVNVYVYGYTNFTLTTVNPDFGKNNGSFSFSFDNYSRVRYKLNNGLPTAISSNPLEFNNYQEQVIRLQITPYPQTLFCNDIDTTFILKGIINIVNDTITMFKGTTVTIPISKNDSDPNRIIIKDSLVQESTKGTVIMDKPKKGNWEYTNTGKAGFDILEYRAKSKYDSADAKVYVYILNTPEIMLEDSCSFKPYMTLSIANGDTYKWEYSSNGTTWTDLNIDNAVCNDITPGKYRATITINNMSYTTPVRELILDKQSVIKSKTWYQMRLE